MMIPEVKQTSADGFDEGSESNNSGFNSTFIIVPLVTCCFAFVIIYVLRIRNTERRMDKTTKDAHEEAPTPLVMQKMQIRPGKNRASVNAEVSPSAA